MDINDMEKTNTENTVYEFDKRHIKLYSIPDFVAIGCVKSDKKWSFYEHIHYSHEYIYVKKGSIKYWCDGQEFIVQEGDFYFIQPGQKHREISYREPIEFRYLKFRYNNNKKIEDPSLQIIRNVDKNVIELIEKILLELENQQSGAKQIVEAIILELIWSVRRILNIVDDFNPNKFGYKNTLVKKAVEYIKLNKFQKLTVKQIADSCNVSPDYLSHIFKDITELTLLQFIESIRMNEAMSMIINSDLNINQIAYKLGYNDSLYFSKKFKKSFGMSPSNYRKQNKP
ncbi:AraC family transcriptional regulator [Vallitalea sediminicola]